MINKQQQGKKSQKKGAFAELVACLILKFKGYEIIARNFRPHKGTGLNEIDIVAVIGDYICFIEVKYRQDNETSAYAITSQTKQRIAKTAEMFVAFNPKYSNYNIRFDALLMSPFSIPMHIKNAWSIDK